MINIVDAIQSLRPGAIWTYHHGKDNFDEALIWQDETQPKPTESEIQAEIARLQADYDSKEYQRLRAPEYPSFNDYLDGVVKGDQAQIQTYIDACLAVKAKYPKGQ
jgi:hypothetical protein